MSTQKIPRSRRLDPYKELGILTNASSAEIKTAYRALVKLHHPDAGGDEEKILMINAAWEILGDPENRVSYDQSINNYDTVAKATQDRSIRNAYASVAAQATQGRAAKEEDALLGWLKMVYTPIDKLLGEIINPLTSEIKELSADPYDDLLMEHFCTYLQQSQNRIKKIDHLYRSIPIPETAKEFGLSLYHCLSEVEDALSELDRYTLGYVDNYLHDGREMMREAKQRRLRLQAERRKLQIS